MSETQQELVARLDTWLRHKPRCAKRGIGGAVDPRCSCGRDALLRDAAARLAAPVGEKVCEWFLPSDYTNGWETTCGNTFEFNDGGPIDNGFTFCPYCDGKITEAPHAD